MNKKLIVTHRGTKEKISKVKSSMEIKSRKGTRKNLRDRICEDTKSVVWVSKGYPNWWNAINSGMVGKRATASVTFEIDKSRVRRPNRLKRIFGNSQLVIDGDVKIPDNAIYIFKD